MPDFSEFFEANKGQPIQYKSNTVILIDKFPVTNGDILVCAIEKTNSDCRQGFYIDITGHCEMDGKVFKIGKGIKMLFWSDTTPKQIKLKVFTKIDFVRVQNIWEQTSYLGTKSLDYSRYGAAMIVEEIENGRRYKCNDWHPDDNFEDIIFTIQKEKSLSS